MVERSHEPRSAFSQDSSTPDTEACVFHLPLPSAWDSGSLQPCLQRLPRQTGEPGSLENKRHPLGTAPPSLMHCASLCGYMLAVAGVT